MLFPLTFKSSNRLDEICLNKSWNNENERFVGISDRKCKKLLIGQNIMIKTNDRDISLNKSEKSMDHC